MFLLPLSIISPGGKRGRLSILIFHRVLAQPDALFADLPDAAAFEQRMNWVREWFNVLPLPDAIERLYAGSIPPRAMAITFDDGYADNEEIAAPILQRLGLHATFFVTTEFLNGGCMWNDLVIEALRNCHAPVLDLVPLGLGLHLLDSIRDRRQAIESVLTAIKHLEPSQRVATAEAIVERAGAGPAPPLMMQPRQVRALRARGMEIGGHTRTHPILKRLSAAEARAEIGGGKDELECILGERIRLFAYPNGVPGQDYAAEHAAMVRDCGFEAAVSTAWGAASPRSDRFQLPRFTPWDRGRWRYGARLLDNYRRSEQVAV